MTIKYDEQHEQSLAVRVKELNGELSDISARMNEMKEDSDKAFSDDDHRKYQEMFMAHKVKVEDRDIAQKELDDYIRARPEEKLPHVAKNEWIERYEEFDHWVRNAKADEQFTYRIGTMSAAESARRVLVTGSAGASNVNANVPTETADDIIYSLDAFGESLRLPAMRVTPNGAPIKFPNFNGTSERGAYVAEGATNSNDDIPSSGFTTIGALDITSNRLNASRQSLADVNISLAAHIQNQLAQRIGRFMAQEIFSGAGGAAAFQGIQGICKDEALASNSGISFVNELSKVKQAVPLAYRNGEGSMAKYGTRMEGEGLPVRNGFIGYVFNDSTAGLLERSTDGDGRPLWSPARDVTSGAPGRIFGYDYRVVEEVQDVGANNRSFYFGNFNYTLLRVVQDIELASFYDSGTAPTNTIMFMGLARADFRSVLAPVSGKNEAIVAGKHPS